jgi:histidinol-phosphate aminotransferase
MNIWDLAKPQFRDLGVYEPGKPVDDVARELGLDPVDVVKLASNENPLGPSPVAVEAMRAVLSQAHIYPDGGGYHLRNAIAEKFAVQRSNVTIGNGSDEIIVLIGHVFLSPGTNIVVSDHAFVVYKLTAALFGAETKEVAEGPGFAQNLEAMADAIDENTRAVFLANPNNPTGVLSGQEEIDRFMARVPDHVVVVFDEAYYEFLDNPPDTLKFVHEGRKVVVLHTFSKIQGLAALRIGYGLSTPEISEVLNKAREPFNTNAVAQAAALAAIGDHEHQERTKAMTDEGRAFLQRTFDEFGLEYVPSFANFVLVKVGDGDRAFADMQREGVIIRAMRGYKLPEWIRVSVGQPHENERFVEVLKNWLAAQA